MNKFYLIIVSISITVVILGMVNSSEVYADSTKFYSYSDDYGYHKIPYNLKYGEITKIDCNHNGLTIYVNAERNDKMILYVPTSSLDMTGDVNIYVSSNSTQYSTDPWTDYRREQLDDSLKITFEVEKGHYPIRIQTAVSIRECNVAPPEDIYYKLNSPKNQIENGILPQKIICKKDQSLILKTSDHSPACVKQETKKILAERGYYDERIWIKMDVDCNTSGCEMPTWIYPPIHTKYSREQFMNYFKNKNIEILDTKIDHFSYPSNGTYQLCEWGECGQSGIEFSFQIFEKDFERMAKENSNSYVDKNTDKTSKEKNIFFLS
jgi:hypothetical protein